MLELRIPTPSLVVLVGAAGCGKSTFARRHFRPTEIVSSDAFRAMVADDEADQRASGDAFELVYLVVRKRLARRRLTVVDATSVESRARRPLTSMADEAGVPAVAIVFDFDPELCASRSAGRAARVVAAEVVAQQSAALRESLGGIVMEGFAEVFIFRSPTEVDDARLAIRRNEPDG